MTRLIGHDRERGQSFEADVSLETATLAGFRWVDTGQAPLTRDEAQVVLAPSSTRRGWLPSSGEASPTSLDERDAQLVVAVVDSIGDGASADPTSWPIEGQPLIIEHCVDRLDAGDAVLAP